MLGIVLVAFSRPAVPQDAETCDPSRIKDLIGKPYSPELAEEARRVSGANSARPIGPGIPSSADARKRRLNLELDNKGVVIGFICG